MKKFLLSLALVALATSGMMAQSTVTPEPVPTEQPDRAQMMHLSKDPTGMDTPTGMDRPQAIGHQHEQCKGHKDGEACNKPADQQCPDCKAKAAAQHQCKKAEGQQCEKAAAQHQCKKAEGQQCEKAAAQHQCKDHKDGKACDKPADQQCPDCKAKAAKKN